MNTRHDTATACNTVGSSISNIYGHNAGSNGQDITHSWSFFLSFTHFQILRTTKCFATSCTLVGFGISMHNKMHAQCAPCGQLQRAHWTLVGGLPMRVTVNLQPVLSLETESSKTHAQLPIQSFSRNCPLIKMVKWH